MPSSVRLLKPPKILPPPWDGGPVVAGDRRGLDVGNERHGVEVVDRGLAFRAVRADHEVHRDLLVEVAERAEDLGPAVLRRIPAEADARGPAPGEVDLLRAVARVHLLVVVAQAEADREARRERHRILQKERPDPLIRGGVQLRGRDVVGQARRRDRPVEVGVDRLARVAGVLVDRDLLAARHPLDDVGLVLEELDAALELVHPHVLGGGDRAHVPLEVLFLDQAEAARLEVVDRIDVLDLVPARERRIDVVLLVVHGALGRDRPAGAEETRVAQGIVAAAEALLADERRVRTVLAADAVGVRPVVGSGILEVAADQSVRAADHPGQLGRAQVAVRIGVRRSPRLGPVGDGPFDRVLHAVVGAEKPQAVLHDVAAEVEAIVETVVARREREQVRVLGMLVVGLERVVVVVDEGVAVEVVAAGLRDDVDDAAGGAAVLGLVTAGLDLELLDELVVEIFPLRAVLDAVGDHAVDDEPVLEARRPVDDHRVGEVGRVRRLRRDAGRDLGDGGVAAPRRQRVDLAIGDAVSDRRRSLVDEGGLSGHDDLRGGRRSQAEIARRGLAECDDRLPFVAGETLEDGRHLVRARRQQDQAVVPRGVRHRRAYALEGRAAALDGHPGKRSALLVGHLAGDVAGGLRRQEERRERHRRKGERQPKASHGTSQYESANDASTRFPRAAEARATSTLPDAMW